MGGKIRVESELDVGSTFHFTVPFEKQSGEPSPRAASLNGSKEKVDTALATLRGAIVLMVEDNPVNQELARELLESNGIIVETADNGREAIELLASQDFDGVLMDCQMPVMDGYTTTRKLRQQQRFKNLPIIAMTASAMKGGKQKVLAAGMNDHIARPVNVNQMFITMAKWIKPGNKEAENKACFEAELGVNDATCFPDLPGIDFQLGIKITNNNAKLYRRLLLISVAKGEGFLLLLRTKYY